MANRFSFHGFVLFLMALSAAGEGRLAPDALRTSKTGSRTKDGKTSIGYVQREPRQVQEDQTVQDFESFLVVDVSGTPSLVAEQYYALLQDLIVETFNTLSSQDDERCKNEGTLSGDNVLLLTNAEILPESVDAFGDKSRGYPDIPSVSTRIVYSYLFAVRGSTSNPCSYFELGTAVPNLFTSNVAADDCACKQGPSEEKFVDLFNELYLTATQADESTYPQPLAIDLMTDVTQEDYVPGCKNSTNVTTFTTTLLMTAPKDIFGYHHREIEQRLLEAYNQANFLNDDICDPFHRVIINVSLEITGQTDCSSPTSEPSSSPSVALSSSAPPSAAPSLPVDIPIEFQDFFVTVYVECFNCHNDTRLFDAVDRRRLDNPLMRKRRKNQEEAADPLFNETTRCLCPVDVELRGPTVEEVVNLFVPGICMVELQPTDCPNLTQAVNTTNVTSTEDEYYDYIQSKLELTLTLNASSWVRLLACNEEAPSSNPTEQDEAPTLAPTEEFTPPPSAEHPFENRAITILEELLVTAYNSLVSEFCDPHGRSVIYAEILHPEEFILLLEEDVQNLLKVNADGPVLANVTFVVVRRCRRGEVAGDDSESCDGLFSDTLTIDSQEEVPDYSGNDRKGRRTARQVLLDSDALIRPANDYVTPTNTAGRVLTATKLQGRAEGSASAALRQRRGLLVSAPCDIDRCFCPTDAIALRAPLLEEFEVLYGEYLSFTSSESVSKCTNALTTSTNLTSSFNLFESISTVDGICPFKASTEPDYIFDSPSPAPDSSLSEPSPSGHSPSRDAEEPTEEPTKKPSMEPTKEPKTKKPTKEPSNIPTKEPTIPSNSPTKEPTPPSNSPTMHPTTKKPTKAPRTKKPTKPPSTEILSTENSSTENVSTENQPTTDKPTEQ